MEKTGNLFPLPLIPGNKGGASDYLYLHYYPPADVEPAITEDMVNIDISEDISFGRGIFP